MDQAKAVFAAFPSALVAEASTKQCDLAIKYYANALSSLPKEARAAVRKEPLAILDVSPPPFFMVILTNSGSFRGYSTSEVDC